VYDARSLAWLLDQAGRKKRHGTLRARAVVRRGATADRVVTSTMYRQAMSAKSSRLRPGMVRSMTCCSGSLPMLGDRAPWRCADASTHATPRSYQTGTAGSDATVTWTLVHSRDADIMAAIHQGDAFLSRLEGEWWLRFLGG